jgi:hypothetical protein
MKNIFNLDKPEEYKCRLMNLTYSHPTLRVLVSYQAIMYIDFWGLHYLNAPLEWQGADFELVGETEAFEILKNAYPKTSDMITERLLVTDVVKVYKEATVPIYIAANSVSINQVDSIFDIPKPSPF